jgi:hypothetical protein
MILMDVGKASTFALLHLAFWFQVVEKLHLRKACSEIHKASGQDKSLL